MERRPTAASSARCGVIGVLPLFVGCFSSVGECGTRPDFAGKECGHRSGHRTTDAVVDRTFQ